MRQIKPAQLAFRCTINIILLITYLLLDNGLLLNPAKTEAVLFDIKVQRENITTASGTDVVGTVVPFRDSVKILGITLDSTLTFDWYVSLKSRAAAAITHAHCMHIRPLLTVDVIKMVGHSIVSSCLDYANALLHCTSANNLHRLQVVQKNSLARVGYHAPTFSLHSAVLPSYVSSSTGYLERAPYRLAVRTGRSSGSCPYRSYC